MKTYIIEYEINTICATADRNSIIVNAESEAKAKQIALNRLIKKHPRTNPQFVGITVIEE